MSALARCLLVLSALAVPASAQFNLLPWTLQDDAGDGIAGLSPGSMGLTADWPTEGGGKLLVFKSFAPVSATIRFDMWYMTFDGACGMSVPVFILDGNQTILASCTSSASFEFPVLAGSQFALGLITYDGTWPGTVTFSNFEFSPAVGEDPWSSLGNGLTGTGTPRLAGTSLLLPHLPFTLTLTDALPSTPVVFIVGFTALNAPFKGGVLVPAPDLVLPGLVPNGSGDLSLSTNWPSVVPSGTSLYFQVWQPDPLGPAGFAASNALRADVP